MTRFSGSLHMALTALLLMGLAMSAAAADRAVDESTSSPALRAWWSDTASTLASRKDIDSVFTAGVILRSGLVGPAGQARGRMLIEQAAEREPTGADIAAMAMLDCTTKAGCDREARVERYRRASPQDALAWLPALKQATNKHDEGAITRALAHMAAARRFSGYWVELTARFHRALAHVPPPPGDGDKTLDPDDARWMIAFSMTGSAAFPGYQAVVAACKPDHPDFTPREGDCRKIGGLLANGETLVQNLIGSRLLAWTAKNASEREAVDAARRRAQWQKMAYGRLAGALPSPAEHAAALLKYRSESRALEAWLVRAGVPLDPPQGWSPGGPGKTRD